MAERVSILVPAYQHVDYVSQTLDSIEGQGLDDVECVLVDDGSADGTAAAAKKWQREHALRLTIIENPHQGILPTLRTALAAATGDVIGMIASDDCYADGALRPHLEAMNEGHFDVLYGAVQPFGIGPCRRANLGPAKAALEAGRLEEFTWLAEAAIPLVQSGLYRRIALENARVFDHAYGFEDALMRIRLAASDAKIGIRDEVVVAYRVHERNTYKDFEQTLTWIHEIVDHECPPRLRRRVRANVLHNHALSLLPSRPRRSVALELRSQTIRPRPRRLPRHLMRAWMHARRLRRET